MRDLFKGHELETLDGIKKIAEPFGFVVTEWFNTIEVSFQKTVVFVFEKHVIPNYYILSD